MQIVVLIVVHVLVFAQLEQSLRANHIIKRNEELSLKPRRQLFFDYRKRGITWLH
nr:MAG TPA: hypothetical protein [Bacteriophage sp.]